MRTSTVRLWTPGDWNAFFGLFTNIVANLLVGAGLLVYVVKIPPDIVYGQIIPATAIGIFAGNMYYAYMARRKAKREGVPSVTALPYGPSVGHLFVVTFLIILPVYRVTNNPHLAWMVGVAWCAVESLTEAVASFVGPWLRRNTPRAAMLAVMAGIAITLIAMTPLLRTWQAPYIGFISLAFILVSWLGRKGLPGNFPAALAMVAVGTAVAWIGTWLGWIPQAQQMSAAAVSNALGGLSPTFPSVNISWEGFKALGPYLATAIPLGIGGFLNTMDNVESASAAGDDYDTREAMLADAGGSLLGAVFGSPFATGVYVGHPGWKALGAGPGYGAAAGIAVLAVSLLGIVPVFQAVVPLVAIFPILIYIGLVMGSQAFQATPPNHAPAVVLAVIPWIVSWGKGLVDNTLSAAGTNAYKLGYGTLEGSNVLYQSMAMIDQGVLLTSMMLGAIAAFAIEQKYRAAAVVALLGGALSFVGLIHAPKVALNAAPAFTLGYLFMAVIVYVFGTMKSSTRSGELEFKRTASKAGAK